MHILASAGSACALPNLPIYLITTSYPPFCYNEAFWIMQDFTFDAETNEEAR